jgi:hypothetical protein
MHIQWDELKKCVEGVDDHNHENMNIFMQK